MHARSIMSILTSAIMALNATQAALAGEVVRFHGSDAAAPTGIGLVTDPDEVFGYGLYRSGWIELHATQPPPAVFVPNSLEGVYQHVTAAATGFSLGIESLASHNYLTFFDVNDEAYGGPGSSVPFNTGVSRSVHQLGEVSGTWSMFYEFWAGTSPVTPAPPVSMLVSYIGLARYQYPYEFEMSEDLRSVSAFTGAGSWAIFPQSSAGTIATQGENIAGTLLVDSQSQYVFAGDGSIQLNGGSLVSGRANVSVAGGGAHTINVPVFASDPLFLNVREDSSLTFEAGRAGLQTSVLSKSGDGTVTTRALSADSLLVGGGSLRINSTGGASRTSLLVVGRGWNDGSTVVASEGVLDLVSAGSSLVLDYDSASPLHGLVDLGSVGAWV